MKKTYQIEVDCANCAAKIENAIGKIEGVQSVSVNYLTQKMSVEAAGDPDALLPLFKKTGKRVDADFSIR